MGERIIINAPTGTDWSTYQAAIGVAHSFACTYTDRKHGKRNCVIYDRRFVAYWTKTRTLVVEVPDGE